MITPVSLSVIPASPGAALPSISSPPHSVGGGFSDFLVNAGQTLKSRLDAAESISVQSLNGGFDPRAVADAVMSAERTLQTAVVIRDKLVAAYLDISRMAI
jgi:flagellar hook-basal body complex protein FliE